MKYGRLSGNQSIDNAIYRCFDFISETDAKKFVRKFKQQNSDKKQVMHTFRELILGGFLGSCNLDVISEYKIDGQTPDWCIFGRASMPECLVELVTFNIDKNTETEITSRLETVGVAAYFPSNYERLYQTIWDKTTKYKALVEKHEIPYVVAVFGAFEADVEQTEITKVLFNDTAGLFALYIELSGVLFFNECSGKYCFSYTHNPGAKRSIQIPEGVF